MNRYVNDAYLVAFFKNFEKHIPISDSEKLIIAENLKYIEVPKDTVVLSQGSRVNTLFYVISGALRAYHLNTNGKEATVMFAIQDWWITDMDGFANQALAQVSLETLENSRLIGLEHATLESLFQKLPKLERFFRILFQRAYIREQSRLLRQLSMDVATRYQSFVEKYPNIVAAVSQKQMASYLGVTPEFLSQVKNK